MSLFAAALVFLSAAMHASWNLMVRDQRSTSTFLSIAIVATVVFFPVVLVLEFTAAPIVTVVPMNLLFGSIFLATYYIGMTNSYRGGDFTVAYPLARAFPVLFLAIAEVLLGNSPTPMGWFGIFLIAAGSILLPLQSFSDLNIGRYWNKTTFWIVFAAVSIAGYSLSDQAGLRQLPNGLDVAMRYSILEAVIGGVFYFGLLLVLRDKIILPKKLSDWKIPFIATVFVYGSYSLILWAFQSDERASYVIGLRQLSIVLGVVAGAYLFHERGARLRIPAAVVITAGVILLSLA